jgi:hypothetical protein
LSFFEILKLVQDDRSGKFQISLARAGIFSVWKALKDLVSDQILSWRRNPILWMTASAWGGRFKGLSPSITPFGKRKDC